MRKKKTLAQPKWLEDQGIESWTYCPPANTTLSPVTVQRFSALHAELIALVEQDDTGLPPKLEQIIRAFKFIQIEMAVYRG